VIVGGSAVKVDTVSTPTVTYTWNGSGDGTFWTDTDQLRTAIKKAGIAPSLANYSVIVHNKAGRPEVDGWSACSYRSTDGMVRQSLGTTIEHSGLGANLRGH
jgi:hypothetical protein